MKQKFGLLYKIQRKQAVYYIRKQAVYYITYKDIVLQRAKEYREKNKGKIKKYQKNRYKILSQKEKIKLVGKRKEWFNKQTKERQDERKRKAREYAENRYHNHIVVVN